MYDVIVIGGGPVGSYVAQRMAVLDYKVALIEQKEEFIKEEVCCTGIVSRECVDSFNIGKEVILRWIDNVKLFSPSGKMLELKREQPFACVLDGALFRNTMVELARHVGADCFLGCSVIDAKVEYDIVKVEAIQEGKEQNFKAQALVVATGPNWKSSQLSNKLGFGKTEESVGGVQVEVDITSEIDVEVYFSQEVAPGFFAWLVPTLQGKAWAGVLSHHNPEAYLEKLLYLLQAQEKITPQFGVLSRHSNKANWGFGIVPLKPPPRTYTNRMLLVGAAAGQVKPTTGGGIYYGLLCADIAADTLIEALLEGDLSVKRLSAYEKNWKGRLKEELKMGYWARKLYEHLSDWEIDKIFDIAESNKMLEEDEILFDWHSEILTKVIGF